MPAFSLAVIMHMWPELYFFKLNDGYKIMPIVIKHVNRNIFAGMTDDKPLAAIPGPAVL